MERYAVSMAARVENPVWHRQDVVKKEGYSKFSC
jgi:hypothetical protein